MQLIILAHRGEAQEFLSNLELKADPKMAGLYSNETQSLLISGEGIYEVMSKLPYALAKYNITSVINLGIAGALDPDLKVNQTYTIRTIYGFNETKPKFKSFTTADKNAKIDCITTDTRVLSNNFAKSLAPFASLVDREVWGIAKCCHQLNIPFYCYKLVSDIAGDATQCFEIKAKAIKFSQILFEAYLSHEETDQIEDQEYIPPIQMSFSNKLKYNKLIKSISARDSKTQVEIHDKINLDTILSKEIRSKAMAQEIITHLEGILNPVGAKIEKALENTFDDFYKIGAQIKMDPKLESKRFKLSMDINSETNIEKLKKALSNFDYHKLEKIWDGDFNVQ